MANSVDVSQLLSKNLDRNDIIFFKICFLKLYKACISSTNLMDLFSISLIALLRY